MKSAVGTLDLRVHMSLRCTFWNKITEIFDKIIAKIIFMGSSVVAYAEWQSVHIFFTILAGNRIQDLP